MRRSVSAAGAVAALALFGVGLIAPLTPSEGCPSLSIIAVFVILPVALPLLIVFLVRARLARVALAAQSIALGATAAYILYSIGCVGS